ncbi:MAG: ABC transporter permease [Anaerolineales bacterium]|nr:ABC transporter permease [Anaerolineales bacterium]
MNITQSILEALESLNANKLRSGLTILGIIIGVGAVIAMLAVGRGAEETITGSISGIGTNLLFVFSGGSEEVRNPRPLTLADARAMADLLAAPHVEAVAPTIQGSVEASYGGEKIQTSVTGATPEYLSMRNYELLEGEFFTQYDNAGQSSVVLIGPEVADELFGRRDGIVGETIRINGQPFRIIGVLASKGGGTFGSEDNVIIMPLETARLRVIRRSDPNRVGLILVEVVDSESIGQATEEISQILRTRHRTEVGADDFTIFSQQDFISLAATITGVLTIFLGGIAGISLLVGGIGIMNIMLVSVTERTREIGLRKALGARKRDILIQFLTESSLLSLLGGVVGIGLGWLIGFIVGQIAARSGTPFTPAIGIDAVLLATIFSTAIGLFFGIYPASRAANLEPVEALRYE